MLIAAASDPFKHRNRVTALFHSSLATGSNLTWKKSQNPSREEAPRVWLSSSRPLSSHPLVQCSLTAWLSGPASSFCTFCTICHARSPTDTLGAGPASADLADLARPVQSRPHPGHPPPHPMHLCLAGPRCHHEPVSLGIHSSSFSQLPAVRHVPCSVSTATPNPEQGSARLGPAVHDRPPLGEVREGSAGQSTA